MSSTKKAEDYLQDADSKEASTNVEKSTTRLCSVKSGTGKTQFWIFRAAETYKNICNMNITCLASCTTTFIGKNIKVDRKSDPKKHKYLRNIQDCATNFGKKRINETIQRQIIKKTKQKSVNRLLAMLTIGRRDK